MTLATISIFVVLLGLLVLSSYVSRIYAEKGKFLAREFQENIEAFEQQVEPQLGAAAGRAALSMSVLTYLCVALLAMLVVFVTMADGQWNLAALGQAVLLLIVIIVVCQQLLPYVFFTRTRGEWLHSLTPLLKGLVYLLLPITLVLGFCLQIAALAEQHEPEQPERQSEAVDALIEAGQEEGILEESDRALIQSVVEFRDKTVREVMTSRPEVVAVPTDWTIEQLTELLHKRPFSRVPVYQGTIDEIKGIVHSHDILQVPDTEAGRRTVASLMKPVPFVPESKPVRELLRDMQQQNNHFAVVIDEYGNVAGIVTIEDMVEEIVGEIRNEHEKAEIVKEGEASYILPGNTDVDRLGELFGFRPENVEATTVGGLVSEIAGHIPRPGEVVEEEGLRYEVLQSTDRRVERLRVSSAEDRSKEAQEVRA
jgi:CBS domain containing-hemolysin-like protein